MPTMNSRGRVTRRLLRGSPMKSESPWENDATTEGKGHSTEVPSGAKSQVLVGKKEIATKEKNATMT